MALLARSIGPEDHVLGNPDGLVTLVEYGDYQCSFSGQAQPAILEVLRLMQDRVRFTFRHFPLANAHPHALMAAVAAEAAAAQGQFWPVHQTLFEHQDALELGDVLGYALDLGVDLNRFADDLESDGPIRKVKRDFATGVRSGVVETPAFFIDGVRYQGRRNVGSLISALELAIAAPATSLLS